MIEPTRILQPIAEAQGAIQRLSDYETPAELAQAVEAVWRAVERSLRLLLRADVDAPEPLRLSALSPVEVPIPQVIESLRQRDRISMELAGIVHELERAVARAARGEVRAADADVARRAVARLDAEVRARGEQPMLDATRHVVENRVLRVTQAVPVPARRGARWRLVAGVGAVVVLAGIIALLMEWAGRGEEELTAGVTAFREGRLSAARTHFREALQEDPRSVTAHLYLGRIYRRERRYREAAEELRTAVELSPNDPDVHRELGHLFYDLEQYQPAIRHYQRAVELDPEASASWIGLIRALRAARDPREAEVMSRAPADVRAALSRPAQE